MAATPAIAGLDLGDVSLSVVDVQGRVVAVLAQGRYPEGRHQALWDGRTGRGVAPVGIYFVRFELAGARMTRRLVMAR